MLVQRYGKECGNLRRARQIEYQRILDSVRCQSKNGMYKRYLRRGVLQLSCTRRFLKIVRLLIDVSRTLPSWQPLQHLALEYRRAKANYYYVFPYIPVLYLDRICIGYEPSAHGREYRRWPARLEREITDPMRWDNYRYAVQGFCASKGMSALLRPECVTPKDQEGCELQERLMGVLLQTRGLAGVVLRPFADGGDGVGASKALIARYGNDNLKLRQAKQIEY